MHRNSVHVGTRSAPGGSIVDTRNGKIWIKIQCNSTARLLEAAESVCTRRPNTVLRIATHTNFTQFLSNPPLPRQRTEFLGPQAEDFPAKQYDVRYDTNARPEQVGIQLNDG